MSKEFLPTILKQKEQEVAAMSYEELQPLRSRSKKPAPV